MTTHCSAKLEPPSVTVEILEISWLAIERVLTILAIELNSDDEFVGWQFGFDRLDNFEDKASAVL